MITTYLRTYQPLVVAAGALLAAGRTKCIVYSGAKEGPRMGLTTLLRCNSDVSFPILGYLNRAKISWAMGDWGGRGPRGPPL